MNRPSEWVSLGEAAQIIGVHPATVRNWAEQGDIPFRRTPGGHRRFRRADLQQWLALHHLARPTEALVIVQSALGRTRLEIGDRQKLTRLEWYTRLSPEAREIMRQQGLRLMDSLIHHLTEPGLRDELHTATEIGQTYGALLKREGLALSEALQGYFYFSDILLESVIQVSEANAPRPISDWGAMLRHVLQFTREILVSMVAVYEQN
jgi:excisionase family DNA binding protein